nr:immunoglobulin light chain junction region [Macaca mulatta]
CQQHDDYPLAF